MKRFLCIALLSWLTLDLPAATPNLLRCNARVSSGGQLFQGTGLWKAALIDGSGASLWSNDGTSVNGAAPASHFTAEVIKGQAALMLGDTGMTALPAVAFTQSGLKMRLWFNDGTHGFQQLTPDQTVQPVPMALVTAQADAPADGAVVTADFASGAVTNAKLAADVITSDKFAAGSVTNAKLAPNAVVNAGGSGYLPAGAVIMSDTEESAALTTAGFVKQGTMTSDQPAWQIPPPAFWERQGHIATWTGTEMLFWGGFQSSSGSNHGQLWRWNPNTGLWRAGSAINEPIDNSVFDSLRYSFGMHTWTGSKWLVWNNSVGAAYDPVADAWTPMSTVGAPSPRSLSAVVWTGSEMLVWGGFRDDTKQSTNDGCAYNPATATWRPISSVGAPTARSNMAAVWTGTEMIVWGGRSGSTQAGGRYNPTTDTWTAMTTMGGPTVDYKGSACAWTGAEMLIANGDGAGNPTPGYRYQPATNTWTAMSTVNEPAQRRDSVFAWTGAELILWGGYDYITSGYAKGDGARYNPTTNTWTTISSLNAPGARYEHAGAWTGTQLVIMGGLAPFDPLVTNDVLGDAYSYDPAMNGWTSISIPNSPPTARGSVAPVWTGTEWIIYGGASSYSPKNGSRYDPSSQNWTPLPDGGPGGRHDPSAVWTGSELLVFGGSVVTADQDDVWKWNPTTNSWTSTSPPTRPSARNSASAVWTGTEMIIYAGKTAAGTTLSDGWRFNPVTNTWAVIATHPLLTGRSSHFACWTGSKMIIWGGFGCVYGGLYDPATNAWEIIDYVDAYYGATVWTGTELIVWGGDGFTPRNTGGRYNPDTQTWTPLPITGAPSARYGHTLVWDGQRAYAWGGDINISQNNMMSDGAIYDPVVNAWTPLPAEGAPLARYSHYATWTGDQLLIWGGDTDIGEYSMLDDLAALSPTTSRWFYVKQ